jgi:hypothetical protein
VVMGDRSLSSKPCGCFKQLQFGPRDTRPIEPPWQREKSVKMMKSSQGRQLESVATSAAQASLLPGYRRRSALETGDLSVPNPCSQASDRLSLAPLTSLWSSHISARPKSMAIARFPAFWPLNLGLLNSHSFGGRSPFRGPPRCVTMS